MYQKKINNLYAFRTPGKTNEINCSSLSMVCKDLFDWLINISSSSSFTLAMIILCVQCPKLCAFSQLISYTKSVLFVQVSFCTHPNMNRKKRDFWCTNWFIGVIFAWRWGENKWFHIITFESFRNSCQLINSFYANWNWFTEK